MRVNSIFNHLDIAKLKRSIGELDEANNANALLTKYIKFYNLYFGNNYAHHIGFLRKNGISVCTQYWTHKNATHTIILVHGLFDHSGLYSHIIKFFLKQNYAVIIFDLPGHGLSSGEQASIEDFSIYLESLEMVLNWANKHLPRVSSLFGQSTGAAIIMDSLFNQSLGNNLAKLDFLIFFAPLLRIKNYCYAKLAFCFISIFLKKIIRKFSRNSSDETFLTFLQSDPLQPKHLNLKWVNAYFRWYQKIHLQTKQVEIPLFIVQGDHDQTVNWKYNTSFINKRFNKHKTLILKSARHHLANEAYGYRNIYFTEITQWLANLKKLISTK